MAFFSFLNEILQLCESKTAGDWDNYQVSAAKKRSSELEPVKQLSLAGK